MDKDFIRDRYEFTDDDKAIIDVTVETVNDLFNSFDKKASYYKRELDQDLEDYIVESVKELSSSQFIVRINIEKDFDNSKHELILRAIRNHFRYMYYFERKKFTKVILKFFGLLFLGVALMSFYYQYSSHITNFSTLPMYSKIVIEGIDIAGWVAYWEAFSCVIFDFIPIQRSRWMYRRIARAKILIESTVENK